MMPAFDINRFDKDSLISDTWLNLLNNAYNDSSLTKRGLSSLLGYNVENFTIGDIINEHKNLEVNSQGFREPFDFSEGEINNSIWCFGCSWTFGVGVSKWTTWPKLLSSKIQNTNIVNFGVPASGPETTYRLLQHYISIGCVPNTVCILGWFPGRIEYDNICYTVNDTIKNQKARRKIKTEILNNSYSIDAILNIKKLLLEHKISNYYINIEELYKIGEMFTPLTHVNPHIDLYKYGSDMSHPGFGTQLTIANLFSAKIKHKLEWVK